MYNKTNTVIQTSVTTNHGDPFTILTIGRLIVVN